MHTVSPQLAPLINAQLFTALHGCERAILHLANDHRGLAALNGRYREVVAPFAAPATRALLDAVAPRPELQAALLLLPHLDLVRQGLAALQDQASAQATLATNNVALQDLVAPLEQTARTCAALLASLADVLPGETFGTIAPDEAVDQDAGIALDQAA